MTADRPARWVFRVLTAAACVIDAVIHLQLAGLYDHAAPSGIGEGNLFRIEAGFALLAAVVLLATGRLLAFVLATLVLGSALAAVLVYRYVDVPAFGPIPAMYEPVWFPKKSAATIAEAAGAALALAGTALRAAPHGARAFRASHGTGL